MMKTITVKTAGIRALKAVFSSMLLVGTILACSSESEPIPVGMRTDIVPREDSDVIEVAPGIGGAPIAKLDPSKPTKFPMQSYASITQLGAGAASLLMVTKVTDKLTILVGSNGYTWLVNESGPAAEIVVSEPKATPPAGTTLLTASDNGFWMISDTDVGQGTPVGSEAGDYNISTVKYSVAKLSITKAPKPLAVSNARLLTFGEGNLQFFVFTGGVPSVRETQLPSVMQEPLAGGFFQDGSDSVWVASDKLLLVATPGAGTWTWTSFPLALEGVQGTVKGLGLLLASPLQPEPVGSVMALTSEGIFGSGTPIDIGALTTQKPAPVQNPAQNQTPATPVATAAPVATPAPLTFAQVQPIINANCATANCHDAVGPTGNANLSTLVAIKAMCPQGNCRTRMMTRLMAGTMPPNRAAFKDGADGQMLLRWLQTGVD